MLTATLLSSHSADAAPKQYSPPNLAVLYDSILPHVNQSALVLYVVPAATEGANRTDLQNWWRQCPYSEMVSQAGIEQARQIAAALRSLKLQVAIAQSAEICASLTTATFIISNLAVKIQITPDLNPPEIMRLDGMKDHVIEEKVRAAIEIGVPGAISIVSGSLLTPQTARFPILTDMQPGDTALFVLGARAEARLLAKLTAAQWREIAEYAKRKAMRAGKR